MGRRGTLQEIEERKAVMQKTESTRYERVQLRLRKDYRAGGRFFITHTGYNTYTVTYPSYKTSAYTYIIFITLYSIRLIIYLQ